MRKNMTRAGLLGTAGLGAVALAVTGFALPASADDHTSSADETRTSVDGLNSLDAFQAWVHDAIAANENETNAGNIGIDGGLVNGPLVSDIGNGAILSGNDTPVLSGNDVSAPVGSGNDVGIEAPIGSGNDVGNGNVVGSGNDTGVTVGDVGAEVGNVTSDITSDIGAEVDDLVGDVSSEVDDLVSGLLDR